MERMKYVLENNANNDNFDENIDNNIIDIENSQKDEQNNTSDVYKIEESDTSDEEYIENEENDNNESDNEVLSELEDDSDEIYHLKEDQKIPLSVLKKQKKKNKSKKCGCGCLCRYLCFIFNPLFIFFIIFAIFMVRIGMIYCKNRNTDCINVDEKCYDAIKTVFFFILFRMFIMIVNKFLHLHKIV